MGAWEVTEGVKCPDIVYVQAALARAGRSVDGVVWLEQLLPASIPSVEEWAADWDDSGFFGPGHSKQTMDPGTLAIVCAHVLECSAVSTRETATASNGRIYLPGACCITDVRPLGPYRLTAQFGLNDPIPLTPETQLPTFAAPFNPLVVLADRAGDTGCFGCTYRRVHFSQLPEVRGQVLLSGEHIFWSDFYGGTIDAGLARMLAKTLSRPARSTRS